MRELIDISQIPSCYGGTGPSLAEAAAGLGPEAGTASGMVVLNELLSLTKRTPEKSHAFELKEHKRAMLVVYTRCKEGASATVTRDDDGSTLMTADIVGETEGEPYSRKIGVIDGPGSFTVALKANTAGSCVFLLLGIDHTNDMSSPD